MSLVLYNLKLFWFIFNLNWEYKKMKVYYLKTILGQNKKRDIWIFNLIYHKFLSLLHFKTGTYYDEWNLIIFLNTKKIKINI